MFKVTKYPHGTFSWVDCNSTDAPKTKAFLQAIMGWDAEDQPIGNGMVYTMFKQDGLNTAGLGQMPPTMQEQGVPSHWMSYINVDDVDALKDKVTALGGKIITEPMDVFESGRMMIIADPTGAMVGLWQAKQHIGAQLVNTPGAFTWNELSTRDPEAVKTFYGQLFDWTFTSEDMPEGYIGAWNKERMNAGIIQMTEEWGDMPPHWMVYLSVADIDATVEKIKGAGGKIEMDITEAPNVGRFTVVTDPTGAHFTVMQLNEPESWKE